MTSNYRFLHVETRDGVATVHLDKPPVNALDEELYVELMQLCDQLDAEPDARAVVFASRNPKMFIAGADIKDMGNYRFEEAWVNAKINRVHSVFNRLEDITKPTVAAIEGYALGGGCEFALAMDFRFMARGKPRIGLPEINIGIIPGGGGTHRLPQVVGHAKAKQLMMTGEHLDADEAERIGLVTRACDPGGALPAAQQFAARLAAQAPVACSMIKQCLRKSAGADREEAMQLEREHCLRAVLSADAREGIAAFVEKRKPRWSGK